MSSSEEHDSCISQLEKQLAVWKRKAEREKKARESAEQHLEQYSREIYQTNQALKRSLDYAHKKQSELSYLSDASAQVVSEQSILSLLQSNVGLTGQFFNANLGTLLVSRNGKLKRQDLPMIWFPEQGWQADADLFAFFCQQIPLTNTEQLDTWIVTPLEHTPRSHPSAKWLVYFKFELLAEQVAWISFISSADLLDEEALYVLDTARGHLLSGVRRRINDIRLGRRNKELQETIDDLETARKQLIQSEKMASLGQMAAGVAHEINNPMGFIRSNSEVLKEYLQDYKTLSQRIQTHLQERALGLEDYANLVEELDISFIQSDAEDLISSNLEGIDRVRDIVNSLKTFSHSVDSEHALMPLFDCIDNALKVAGNSFSSEHQVDNQISPELPQINGNFGQLQQVLVNIFVNSAHAMPEGGLLKIESEQTEESIVISISDTGCGMDESTLKQLFTPFFTTKAVGVGTGLGLSVSYAILEEHHASVEVTSEVGRGSCFILTFPIPE